jgi:hypothetical protein
MVMKSKRTLFQDLAALEIAGLEGIGDRKLDHPRISNETYGRKSFVYVTFAKGERVQMERRLAALGHKIHPDYWPGSSVSEIQVTYFKGWHWNE